MSEQERLKIVQGVIDRLLYLDEKNRDEFLKYIDALFSVYKPSKETRWGSEIFINEINENDGNLQN